MRPSNGDKQGITASEQRSGYLGKIGVVFARAVQF
jgi:hypothetical protein